MKKIAISIIAIILLGLLSNSEVGWFMFFNYIGICVFPALWYMLKTNKEGIKSLGGFVSEVFAITMCFAFIVILVEAYIFPLLGLSSKIPRHSLRDWLNILFEAVFRPER